MNGKSAGYSREVPVALTPMLHKKDEENITNRYGCWGIAESASYFWNAPAVQRTFHTLKQ
jgi:hypothetical protein